MEQGRPAGAASTTGGLCYPKDTTVSNSLILLYYHSTINMEWSSRLIKLLAVADYPRRAVVPGTTHNIRYPGMHTVPGMSYIGATYAQWYAVKA